MITLLGNARENGSRGIEPCAALDSASPLLLICLSCSPSPHASGRWWCRQARPLSTAQTESSRWQRRARTSWFSGWFMWVCFQLGMGIMRCPEFINTCLLISVSRLPGSQDQLYELTGRGDKFLINVDSLSTFIGQPSLRPLINVVSSPRMKGLATHSWSKTTTIPGMLLPSK